MTADLTVRNAVPRPPTLPGRHTDWQNPAAALARTALVRSTQRCARARKADHSLPPLGVATSNVTDRAPGVDGARPGGTAATLWVVTLLIATIATTLQIHNGFELADMAWWTATR